MRTSRLEASLKDELGQMRAQIQNALISRTEQAVGIAASGENTAAKQPPTWSPPGLTNMTDSRPVDETVRCAGDRVEICTYHAAATCACV